MSNPPPFPALTRAAFVVTAALLAAPGGLLEAQSDPSELLDEAREHQRNFELFRQSRIPVEQPREGGGCDARIGRICIWFGGADEERFPEEPPETERARRSLIGDLLEIREEVADPWLTGQLVHYLVEQRDHAYAERVAEACGIPERWWCDALLGYSLHVRGAFVEAEERFRRSLEAMPEERRRDILTLGTIVSEDTEDTFQDMEPEERVRQWERFWRLSDPLFLVPGNDRLTDHFARWVVARNREEAENPQGLLWERDLDETLMRYGRIVGWSRSHAPQRQQRGLRVQLRDNRNVIGHHNPRSRGYLFPERFLESPADIPPESWITAPREARTWYAPPYAPDFRGLETQVGRFRRGDRMLVVGAYQPAPPTAGADPTEPFDPFAGAPRSGEAALFLVPLDQRPPIRYSTEGARGVVTAQAEPGEYVSSLELFDPEGRRAWRARQGIKQAALFPGQVSVSDLLILGRDAPLPSTLDEAIPHVRPGVRVAPGERFTIVWEVYGLQVDQPVDVTVGFTEGRPAFLERVGEFLGIVEPEEPVEITFEDTATEQVQSAFRAIQLQLPELEPGEYTLHLRLDLPDGDPIITSRPVVVEGG